MDDLFKLILSIDQCGILSAVLAAALIYQTYQLGRERAQRDVDRRQIVSDAEARTRSAEAQTAAQREMVALLERRRSSRES